MYKKIAVIGSTGSIGRQTLEVVAEHPDLFKVVCLVAGHRSPLFQEQVATFKPCYHAVASEDEQQAIALAGCDEADIVVVAASGFAGLPYTLRAIESGKAIALANKETLVCGGDLVMPLVEKSGIDFIPVDSEHSAIWQCLHYDRHAPVKNLIITASGGAFRGYTREQLANVTAEQALAHPTWNMGPKITIDSATLLNKGFEVIEAHHLYGTPFDHIKTVIQPTSTVHSMVEFADGCVLAQLSNPTMKLPIQQALTFPDRVTCDVKPMDFSQAFSLQFMPLNRAEHPCFDLALRCGEAGGILPTALNGAGEVAVWAFIKGQIPFLSIADVIDGVVQKTINQPVVSFEQLCQVDATARRMAQELIKR